MVICLFLGQLVSITLYEYTSQKYNIFLFYHMVMHYLGPKRNGSIFFKL